ncbi:MAG: tetratricopeptide repeat protein [Chloroflexi bacterium]|nr:tetratricopeptide repeat protein [Chloroflexota bacterium]
MAKQKKKPQFKPVSTVQAKGGAPAAATPETAVRRGLEAFRRGDYTTAIQTWQQARRSGAPAGVAGALAEAIFRRALATTNQARRAQDLQEAIALAPSRAVYQFHLGLAYHRQGQLRRALAAYEEAHRLAPADARIGRHLALALLADPSTAPRVRDLFKDAPPRDEVAMRLRALADLRTDDTAAAIGALAARKTPSLLASLALGLAQLAAGQLEAAQTALGRVLRSRQPIGQVARQAAVLARTAAQVRTGDLSGALRVLSGLEVPEDPALRHAFADVGRRLAVELVLAERSGEALSALERSLRAEPDQEDARRCLGHLQDVLGTQAARRGDFATAARHWHAALAIQPDNSRIVRNLALAEERLEQWQSAGARWEALIRQWRKELQSARRQDDAAAAELRQRLNVAYRHLAGTHEAAGELNAAARTIEQALNFDTGDVDLRLRAAELYLANEQHSAAIEHLRRVLAARPNDVKVLLDLGAAYDLKGDDRQAQAYMEQALALDPQNPAIRKTLASTHHGRAHQLADSGLKERAIAEYERAVELDPSDSEHFECMAALYLELGRLDGAEAAFGRVLKLHPGDPAKPIQIGSEYLKRGFQKEAEKLFKQALRFSRGPHIQASIALAYLHWGDPARAEPYLKKVLKGREPNVLTLVGQMLTDLGRVDEAVPYLERALELDPTNVMARAYLAMAKTGEDEGPDADFQRLLATEAIAIALGDRKLLNRVRSTIERFREVMGGGPFGDEQAGGRGR